MFKAQALATAAAERQQGRCAESAPHSPRPPQMPKAIPSLQIHAERDHFSTRSGPIISHLDLEMRLLPGLPAPALTSYGHQRAAT